MIQQIPGLGPVMADTWARVAPANDQDAHRKAKGSRGGRPPTFDLQLYRLRHAVENGAACLQRHCGVATRYDKLAVRSKPS